MVKNTRDILISLSNNEISVDAAEKILNDLNDKNRWLSPIKSEREWQEKHIKKIWGGYPNICPNWQILNGLIRFSCEKLEIEVNEP